MAELTELVILVTQGAPALVLGDQAVLQVVLEYKRPMAVIDVHQAPEGVVAVVNCFTIRQGFHQQAACSVALISGNQFVTVITEFGFLEQLAVEVVLVGRTATVETGFLLDQAVKGRRFPCGTGNR